MHHPNIKGCPVSRADPFSDKEGTGQRIGCSIHCHLALFHAFEETGLGPRDGAVDFIGQQHVGHDRAGVKDEPAR